MAIGHALSIVVPLAIGTWLLARIPTPSAAGPRRRPISIVVPARDEETALPDLLASLARQLGADDEVIVVDDQSSDATAAVASAGGATVVPARALPDGWTGKTWACQTGAGVARHPTLLFLDADVILEPGALDRVAAELDRRGGLVSVQPHHRVERPFEHLSAFFNLIAMMGTGAFTPVRTGRGVGAFGPVMATSVEDYRRAGGHEAVAGEVVEDVALAARYRAEGLPVALFGGRGVAGYRMYRGGIRALVQGWSKNFATGARATRPLVLVAIVAWLSLCIIAAVPDPPWLYAAVAVHLWWMLRRVGTFSPVVAILFPVALAFFLVVFAWACSKAVRGQVTWRGRKIVRRK